MGCTIEELGQPGPFLAVQALPVDAALFVELPSMAEWFSLEENMKDAGSERVDVVRRIRRLVFVS
jgi:hypothetical protein